MRERLQQIATVVSSSSTANVAIQQGIDKEIVEKGSIAMGENKYLEEKLLNLEKEIKEKTMQ